jgi:trk system potassium uptake protein TrkA
MRIIIAGAGRLGREMAEELAVPGNEVTLMDTNDDLVDSLKGTLKAQVVYGDACEPASLEEAGALRADVLVACTGDDEDNLVISLLAKRHFDVPRVVARVNNPGNEWLFTDRWGVDAAVSASNALLPIIEEATGSSDTVGLLQLRTAGVGVVETMITDLSRAAGKTLAQLHLPQGAIVASVVRDGKAHVPGGDFELHAGDEVLVVSDTATKQEIREAFQ